ncbi:MAG: hypothetical protein HXY40_05425 [Chloroflexi bacterium]|nr:hypothetical protein [Chloroflexota bacterium]
MTTRSCFLIGPMSDDELGEKARLRRLKTALKPLLAEFGYSVRHPWDLLKRDRIMHSVIEAIDRADLVIADLTGNNPNVFYELGICHSLGVPTILVREKPKRGESAALLPFDIRDFVYIDIDIAKAQDIRERLRNKIEEIHRQIEDYTVFDNPVTLYYREPITNISPAAGLAQGYYHNFVKPIIDRLKWMNPEQTEHIYSVRIESPGGQSVELGKSVEARHDLKLHIILPLRVEYCTEDRISAVKRHVQQAVIQTERRDMTVMARLNAVTSQLLDIPSAMNVMNAALKKRAGQLQVRKDSADWRAIERDEVNRFHFELRQWIDENDHAFRRRVKILHYDPENVEESLHWLHEIWVD